MFSIFANPTTLKTTNLLCGRFRPENCYIITVDPETRKNVEAPVRECFIHKKMSFGEYDSVIWAKECPPLDEDIIRQMAAHEPEVLRMMDRLAMYYPMDFESRKRLYHTCLRYWNHFLDRAEISAFVCYNVPHEIYDYIIYLLCKKKNIPIAVPYMGALRTYVCFFDDIYNQCPQGLEIYRELQQQYSDMPMEDIPLSEDYQRYFDLFSDPQSDKTPDYMRRRFVKLKRLWNSTASTVKLLKKAMGKGPGYIAQSWSKAMYFHKLRKPIKRSARGLLNAYDRLACPADMGEPYIYFPLHHQPECTTSPLGGVFVDQLLAIQMIAYHLPSHVKVYVKEHPVQKGWNRSKQLYSDLAALPNVVLIDRAIDTYALIQNSLAVATVIGTAGFEALFMGKPFLMFGSQMNMYAPGTFNIRSNEDCKTAIEYILQHGAKHTIKDMKIYFKMLEQVQVYATMSPELIHVELSEDENAARLAKGIGEVLARQIAQGSQRGEVNG